MGDNTFKDVPVGIDPSTWPLDINVQYARRWEAPNGVYPSGNFKVYGNFCWGGDKGRAGSTFCRLGSKRPRRSPAPTSKGQARSG